MPKNPLKGFVRRKSSGHILDLPPDQAPAPPAAGSSFRVLERPNGGIDRRTTAQRPFSAMPFGQLKGKSTDDLARLGTKQNRGSGTTTLSGSSGYYDTSSSSARYSSSSTLPSSFEQENEQAHDELFSQKGTAQSSPTESQAAPHPTFSARASRAMSFGLKKKPDFTAPMQEAEIEPVPALPENTATRDRTTTISSYASTAVPPRLESNLGSGDFSSDFGNMFEDLGESKKNSPLPPPPRAPGGYLRSDSEPVNPAHSYSRPTATPSSEDFEPEPQRVNKVQNLNHTKRYSWQSRTSNDGLMSPGLEPDSASPRSSEFSQDTVKPPTGFNRFRPGYQPLPLRYSSPDPHGDSQPGAPKALPPQPLRQVSISSDEGSSYDDDVQPKAPISALRHGSPTQTRQYIPQGAPHPSIIVKDDHSDDETPLDQGPQNATPRARQSRVPSGDASLFDGPTAAAVSLAVRSPPQARLNPSSQSPQKRMTRAQFEMHLNAPEEDAKSEESSEDDSEDGYDDGGDEEERQAEIIRQRRKQEANLAIYRQQMMKASGGQPADLPSQMERPGMGRTTMSAPLLQNGMSEVGGAEEDDDVPLGILQAHGFPNKNRPPTRVGSGSAPPTPGSQNGSVTGDAAGGVLPPFARKLPQLPPDPYFGAGIVNPSYRESLALGGNSGGSVYGGSAPAVQPVHPGGLVGVIAGEERAKAARRASPLAGGGFGGPMPLPNNLQMPQMPPMMPRSNSMMSSIQPPPMMGGMMTPMGMPQMGMPQMVNPMANDTQQQMIQMMQMQQQMMQSLIQMQAGQVPNTNFQPAPSMAGVPTMGGGLQIPRPMSTPGNPPGALNDTGRSMSMMQPPPQWGSINTAAQGRANTMTSNSNPLGYAGSVYNYNLSAPAPGYTPSIAPSERSNVGMPSRYRPVSTMEANGDKARAQTMTSNMEAVRQSAVSPLAGGAQAPKSTIRAIEKPKGTPRSPPPRDSVDDEDDDEGWAQMRQKREARKTRKNTSVQKTPEPALSELYTTLE